MAHTTSRLRVFTFIFSIEYGLQNCQPEPAPLAAVDGDDGQLEEREIIAHAADQFKSSLVEELAAVMEWYLTSMQVSCASC